MNCPNCDKPLHGTSCKCNNKIPECVVEAARVVYTAWPVMQVNSLYDFVKICLNESARREKLAANKKIEAEIRKYQNILKDIRIKYKGDMSTWPEETQESFREAVFKLNDLMYVF